jgi:hypothetical protein
VDTSYNIKVGEDGEKEEEAERRRRSVSRRATTSEAVVEIAGDDKPRVECALCLDGIARSFCRSSKRKKKKKKRKF